MSDGWQTAPCGLLTLHPDGTVLAANETFLSWVGRPADDVVGRRRLSELFTVGGRIYWETHLALLLQVEGRLDEVAVELRGPAERRPVLLTAQVEGPPEAQVVQAVLSGVAERVRYERELVAARAAAERSEGRLRALQEVTAGLSAAVGVTGVVDVVLDAVCGSLGGQAATVWLGSPRSWQVHSSRREDAPVEPPGELAEAPFEKDGRLIAGLPGSAGLRGLLSVLLPTDLVRLPLDVEVLQAVAQQVGLALDRAQLYEEQASVALTLQRALLSAELPSHPRLDLVTAYRPAVESLEVGGDWFDAFLVDDGTLAVVVGDVVGRGLQAASAMGQLRSATRALAAPGAGPAKVLAGLDRFVEQVPDASMATVVYAELDLATGWLTYACAGHPPPLVLCASADQPAQAALLWEGRSAPLGAYGGPSARTQATTRLRTGDRLLLYTDGLVERRSRGIDVGLDRLVDVVRQMDVLAPARAVPALVDALLADEQVRDDVCVLLLHWTGEHLVRHLDRLEQLPQVRHDLRDWLLRADLAPTVVDDLVLAGSEVLANALEHAGHHSARTHAVLQSELHRADARATVVMQVRDDGTWREGAPSEERGRGLAIVRALVDELDIRSDDGTTVVLRRSVGA